MGIPVRIDHGARASEQRQSLIRSLVGIAFSSPEQSATDYVEKSWKDDHLAKLVVKRLDITERDIDGRIVTRDAVTPMTVESSGLPVVVAVNILPLIAPKSAATRLFARCRRVSLDGVSRIFFPRIDYDPDVVMPIYIGEGGGVLILTRSVVGTTHGPTKKILVGAGRLGGDGEGGTGGGERLHRQCNFEADIMRSLDATPTFDAFANGSS